MSWLSDAKTPWAVAQDSLITSREEADRLPSRTPDGRSIVIRYHSQTRAPIYFLGGSFSNLAEIKAAIKNG